MRTVQMVVAALGLICGVSFAQQCESVISLSKVSTSTTEDKSAVEQHASNFCSEYSKTGGKSSSSSFGASYKFLSLSGSHQDASVEAIASKYCSASSGYAQSSDAYRKYVEAIAPGAYEAYQQCIQLSNRDVRFAISAASTLPTEFSMVVSFAGSTATNRSAEMSANPATGISCTWDGRQNTTVKIQTGQSSVLKCVRQGADKRGYVIVTRIDGTKESMTMPWQAYGRDGIPVDALSAFEARIRKLEADLSTSIASYSAQQGILSGVSARASVLESATSVVLARTNKCPSGWKQVGNLLVGVNPEGTAETQASGITLANAQVGGWQGAHPALCVRS